MKPKAPFEKPSKNYFDQYKAQQRYKQDSALSIKNQQSSMEAKQSLKKVGGFGQGDQRGIQKGTSHYNTSLTVASPDESQSANVRSQGRDTKIDKQNYSQYGQIHQMFSQNKLQPVTQQDNRNAGINNSSMYTYNPQIQNIIQPSFDENGSILNTGQSSKTSNDFRFSNRHQSQTIQKVGGMKQYPSTTTSKNQTFYDQFKKKDNKKDQDPQGVTPRMIGGRISKHERKNQYYGLQSEIIKKEKFKDLNSSEIRGPGENKDKGLSDTDGEPETIEYMPEKPIRNNRSTANLVRTGRTIHANSMMHKESLLNYNFKKNFKSPNHGIQKSMIQIKSAEKFKIKSHNAADNSNDAPESEPDDSNSDLGIVKQETLLNKKTVKTKDYKIHKRDNENIGKQTSHFDSQVTTVIQTPKPQPKPFNPPRDSLKLTSKVSKSKPSALEAPKSRQSTKVGGKAQMNNLQSVIVLGDSDYSEPDEIESGSKSKSFGSEADRSEDASYHSSDLEPDDPHKSSRNPLPFLGATDKHIQQKFNQQIKNYGSMITKRNTQSYHDILQDTARVEKIQDSAPTQKREESLNYRNRYGTKPQKHAQKPRGSVSNGQRSQQVSQTVSQAIIQAKKSVQKGTDISSFKQELLYYDTEQRQIDEQNFSNQQIPRIKSFESGKMLRYKNKDADCKTSPFDTKNRGVNGVSEGSQDANVEVDTPEANSVSTFNRKPSLAINRKTVFEMSFKLSNLKEVPIHQLQTNWQLKILDLSHNQISQMPCDTFSLLASLQKLNLDYNELKSVPKIDDSQDQKYPMGTPSILSKLQSISICNNKLKEFPMHLFVRSDGAARQQNLNTIQINDNQIALISHQISQLKALRTLMMHTNPLVSLPVSIHLIFCNFQEFSIDWLSFLLPFVGRIIRLKNDANDQQVDEKSLERNPSASRIRIGEAAGSRQQHQSKLAYVPGTQACRSKVKITQKDRAIQTMDNIGALLVELKAQKKDPKAQFQFSEFLTGIMRKFKGQDPEDTIRTLRYPPRNRTILHQLTEDNNLPLIQNILSVKSEQSSQISQKNYRGSNRDHEKASQVLFKTFMINAIDSEDTTILILALKNKYIDICRFLLKQNSELVDILIKSKKFTTAIQLAMKNQEFEIIDAILNHHQVKRQDSHVLNCIIPVFEKNPTENAKYMVKLLLEQGMDPNYLREKFLKKDVVEKDDQRNLPTKIYEISPISLACQKYQNNALNFVIKFNSTLREILALNQKVRAQREQNNARFFMDKDPYQTLMGQLDPSKQARVRKFFTYIEDISKSKNVPRDTIIRENIKLFDFNILSGPRKMHALHYTVQANNFKALEKLRRIQKIEKIDFFARDGESLDLPQEFAAPSAPIYKIVLKAQKCITRRKFIENNTKNNNQKSQHQKQIVQTKSPQQNQLSIGEAFLEQNADMIEQDLVHKSINLRCSNYKKPKVFRQNDHLSFRTKQQTSTSQNRRPSRNEQLDSVIHKNLIRHQKEINQQEKTKLKSQASSIDRGFSQTYKYSGQRDSYQLPQDTDEAPRGSVVNTTIAIDDKYPESIPQMVKPSKNYTRVSHKLSPRRSLAQSGKTRKRVESESLNYSYVNMINEKRAKKINSRVNKNHQSKKILQPIQPGQNLGEQNEIDETLNDEFNENTLNFTQVDSLYNTQQIKYFQTTNSSSFKVPVKSKPPNKSKGSNVPPQTTKMSSQKFVF